MKRIYTDKNRFGAKKIKSVPIRFIRIICGPIQYNLCNRKTIKLLNLMNLNHLMVKKMFYLWCNFKSTILTIQIPLKYSQVLNTKTAQNLPIGFQNRFSLPEMNRFSHSKPIFSEAFQQAILLPLYWFEY
jgi:hypothetical protein